MIDPDKTAEYILTPEASALLSTYSRAIENRDAELIRVCEWMLANVHAQTAHKFARTFVDHFDGEQRAQELDTKILPLAGASE